MAIALLVFERFCRENKFDSPHVVELSDYLWQWPMIQGPDQFSPWERSRPQLVNFGLGDEADDALKAQLCLANLDESRFREIVSALIEILWGSFWGAAEDDLSLRALEAVILLTKVSVLPPLAPFKFSRFADRDGWGATVCKGDRDYWRRSYQ